VRNKPAQELLGVREPTPRADDGLGAAQRRSIGAFLDHRFARFRGTDAPEDAAANAKTTEPCDADS